ACGCRGAVEAVGARCGGALEASRQGRLANREEGQDHLLPERRYIRLACVRACGCVRAHGARTRRARAVFARGDARTARLDANGQNACRTVRAAAVVAD